MRVTVKLFSILRQCVEDYDPERGVVVELNADAAVSDLIRKLDISSDKAPVVSCNGLILNARDPLSDGSVVHIFQPVAGG